MRLFVVKRATAALGHCGLGGGLDCTPMCHWATLATGPAMERWFGWSLGSIGLDGVWLNGASGVAGGVQRPRLVCGHGPGFDVRRSHQRP